jgi:O-antigen/teichoic acid export membrane protein
MPPESVTVKASRSLKWSALMEIVSRTASPIIFVILARVLTPADFGVLATAMIAISFAQMFWDAGLSKALIQTREAPEEAAHVVFWTNIFLSIPIYILLFISAPAISLFFKSVASGPVLRVLGLQIVIASFSAVQQALFVRDLDFRGLFWIKLLTGFVPGLCSIPMAFFGYGVWALVAGSLVGQVLNCWLLWRRSAWRPRMQFDSALARKLFGFGIWAVGESLAAWFILWGDSVLVGKFLGVHDLGVYRTGWMLVTIIFGLVLNPFLPVLYPTFSRLQDDLPALKSTFRKLNQVVMALALPIGVGLFLIGPDLADALFGNKWQGLGFVVSVVGLTNGIVWIVGINTELYRAMSRPDINAKLLFFAAVYYLPTYFMAAPFGLKVFTCTRFIVGLLGILIHIYICNSMLKFPRLYLWHEGKKIIIATLFMGFIVAILKSVMSIFMPDLRSLMILAVLIISGMIVYTGSLWLMDRSFVMQTKNQLIRAAQG